jgi:hypothetical protein
MSNLYEYDMNKEKMDNSILFIDIINNIRGFKTIEIEEGGCL